MIELRGFGLFRGEPAVVRLARCDGPFAFVVGGQTLSLATAVPSAALLSTDLTWPEGTTIHSVEHLAAAAAGLGLHAGVQAELLEGTELPLLDGAAGEWARALASLGATPAATALAIARAAETVVEGAVYTFTPGPRIDVHVELRTDHAYLERHAAWSGDAGRFVRDLAPARTFVFATDLEAYAARGASVHVAPEQVVIVGAESLQAAGTAAEPSEPVRHKLLDLLGDLFVHGGPPRGTIRATAPGHAKTHRALAWARATGVIAAMLLTLAPRAAHADNLPFSPSPLSLPALDHRHIEMVVDSRVGFFTSDGTNLRHNGVAVRHSYSLEVPILPRRVFLGARYAFATGDSLNPSTPSSPLAARTSGTVSGNTELTIRSLWVAPAGLALGGALDLVLPTGYYRADTTAGDVAKAARAMSPNDWLSFWQRAVGFRPSFDVRIRVAGFTFQLRQSLTFAVGVASSSDSSMVAEVGLYAGQQVGPVQVGLEVAELYFLDNLFTGVASSLTDSRRARFAFMPQVRLARGPLRPSLGVMYSPASAYDGTSLLNLHLSIDFAL